MKRSASRTHLPATEISHVPTLEKGHTSGGISEMSDMKSSGELVETAVELDERPDPLANPIARFRHKYKEYLAEFIGTMVLIIFGNGVNVCRLIAGYSHSI